MIPNKFLVSTDSQIVDNGDEIVTKNFVGLA